MRVPDRLEQLVGEPQRHQILDGLLAQIVVDAEDVVRSEHAVDQLVEFASAFQIVPEGLLDHDAPPAAAARVAGHSRAVHLFEHDGEHGRRDRQVERRVALDPMRVAQVVESLSQRVERLIVVERPWHELEVLVQPAPDVIVPLGASVRLCRFLGQRREITVTPVPPSEAEQREVRRQQTPVAGGRDWPGRRSPASASYGPGHR